MCDPVTMNKKKVVDGVLSTMTNNVINNKLSGHREENYTTVQTERVYFALWDDLSQRYRITMMLFSPCSRAEAHTILHYDAATCVRGSSKYRTSASAFRNISQERGIINHISFHS